MYVNESQRVTPFHFSALCDIFEVFFQKKIFQKNFQILFCSQSGNSDFPVISSMKGWLESVFKTSHEYVLSIFRKLCASWALDIAPTLDVPVLLFLFFSSDYSLIVYVPLFVNYLLLAKVLSTWFWTHPKASTWKCKTQKGPLPVFGAMTLSPPLSSALRDFVWNSFVFKGSPFLVFCNWMDVETA